MRTNVLGRKNRTNSQSKREFHLTKGVEKISNLHGNRKWFLEIKKLSDGIKYLPKKDSNYPDMKPMLHTYKHFIPLNDRSWYRR